MPFTSAHGAHYANSANSDIRGIQKRRCDKRDMAVKNPGAMLERLTREPEAPWLEFKLNNVEPQVIGESISALANGAILVERGTAYLVFGVEDKTRALVGTNVRLNTLKKGNEDFQNWLARLLDPRIMFEAIDFEHNGLNFSIITIEPTYERPVKFNGSAYFRIGQNVKRLAEYSQHERAVWNATNRQKFEHSIASPNQSLSSVLDLLDVSSYYKLMGLPLPENELEIARKLCHDKLIVDDMEGSFHITNLGAVLISIDITQFPPIKGKSVRVIKYKGTDKRVAESEREGQRGYATGFVGLMKFIMDRIPKVENYVSGLRINNPIVPEIAVREVLANAMIHQDFTITGMRPEIEIYENRIEVVNPGNSLIETDRMLDERRSRNEALATNLRFLGICEERGGGLDKAIDAIEALHLPAPDFISSQNSMRVVLFGPRSFREMTRLERQRACFFHCIICWMRHEFMGNSSLRDRFSLRQEEYQAVSLVIADCIKNGRIIPAERNQGKKNARYVPYWVRIE